jgi:hypothetical protein
MGIAPQGENFNYLTPGLKSGYLWPHHRKMIRLVVCGCTPSEIKSLTGFSGGAITRILASPHFQAEVERLMEISEEIAVDIKEDLKQLAAPAIEVLTEDVNMEVNNRFERKLRQDAAKDILDRAGFRKNSPINTGGNHLHLHEAEAKEMSDKDLQDDVMDLVKVSNDKFE